MLVHEDFAAAFRDALTLGRVLGDAAHGGHQLVAAHADAAAHMRRVDLDSGFGKRLHPGGRMGIVAVDERSIDVQEYRR
jgi:hypothetical protein